MLQSVEVASSHSNDGALFRRDDVFLTFVLGLRRRADLAQQHGKALSTLLSSRRRCTCYFCFVERSRLKEKSRPWQHGEALFDQAFFTPTNDALLNCYFLERYRLKGWSRPS